jgi:hypothetical protein
MTEAVARHVRFARSMMTRDSELGGESGLRRLGVGVEFALNPADVSVS